MRRILTLLSLTSLLLSSELSSQTRIQVGLETDDNIRETPSEALGARSFRLLVDSRKLGNSHWSSVSFQQVTALQVYWNHSEENKLASELRFGSDGKLGLFHLNAAAWGRLKLWLNDVFDYGTGGVRLEASAPILRQLFATAELHVSALDYADLDGFDSRDVGLGSGLVWRRGSRSFGMMVRWQQIRFNRAAVATIFTPDPAYVFLPHRQRDSLASAELSASQSGRLLARLSYELQNNRSNSFGFSYWRHRLQLLLGARLGRGVVLRLLAAGQLKHYVDTLPPGVPTLPSDLDTEREQSNFIVADLSHPLASRTNLVLRLAWYSNETPLRGRFYQKRLATLAIEARL